MQVGDLVKFYPGLLDETMYDKLGIVMEIDEEDGIVIVKFSGRIIPRNMS